MGVAEGRHTRGVGCGRRMKWAGGGGGGGAAVAARAILACEISKEQADRRVGNGD
jgi:hypothetical protein